MELQEQDSKAFEEIVSILQCHPEIEKFELAKEPILSLPGLEIYPSKRKVFRDRQEIQLTTKEYEILLLLVTHAVCSKTTAVRFIRYDRKPVACIRSQQTPARKSTVSNGCFVWSNRTILAKALSPQENGKERM